MKSITVSELKEIIAANPAVTLLDVRTPPEFESIHVPGARNIPLSELDPKALLNKGTIHLDQPVYLLCQSGTRAGHAGEKFAAAGYENPFVVEGGTQGWEKAGHDVVRGKSAVSLERQVRIAAGALVLTGILLAYFVHHWFIGVSAFVGAGLVFAGITDWCGMGLLLARAPWNQR